MLSARDRLLAALFAFQLAVAAVLGIYLVNALDEDNARPVTLQQGPAAVLPSTQATTGPSAAPLATSVAQVPGTSGSTVTTVTGGGDSTTGSTTGGGTGSAPLAAGAPIKIGAVVSQTGVINFASTAQATKAYFDRVNSRGGVNGHKIILDLRDDQLDSTRGKQQAQQLLAEGVFAFVGWNAPNTESDITAFLEQNKLPLIGAYGTQAEYHSKYAYAFSASYGHYGFQMGQYLAEQGVKKPGLVYLNNNNANADKKLVAAFKAGFKSKGVTLADGDVVSADVTKASYDDVVTQFRLDGVDGFASLLDQTAYNRLNQAQDRAAYHPKHAADSLFLDPSVKQSSTTNGTFVATDYDFIEGGGPEIQDYVTTTKAAYGSKAEINYFGEQGWVDAVVFVEAVKALGTTITRPNLLAVMDKLNGEGGFGFTSDLQFGPGVRDINRCIKFGKVVNLKIARVTDWRCDSQPF